MFLRKKGQQSQYNKLDEVNNMLESIGYKKIKDNLIDDDVNIIVKNGEKYIELDNWGTFDTNTIIEIKDLKYSSGTYMANFTYTMLDNEEINLKGKMDNIDLKEATISFKMNEDKTYSIFKVVKFEKENSNEKQENNIEDVLIENNELIGSWEPSFAKENNQEISLRNIYGSGISGTMNFDSNGKYTAFIGNYSSEFEDDLQGDYINGRSSITLIAKSGKKEILTIKVIDGIKYLEKQIGITNQYVYFKKSASNNISNVNMVDLKDIKDVALEWRNISKIKNYKEFIYDLDGDNVKDTIKVKISSEEIYNQIDYRYTVELNGKAFIEEYPVTVFSEIYIVDLNKNDNKIEVVIQEDAGSDDPVYSVYSKNGDSMNKIIGKDGFNIKTNQTGIIAAKTKISDLIEPDFYENVFEVKNGIATKKEINLDDYKNTIFRSEDLYFTQDMNNISKYSNNHENNEDYTLENAGIYTGEFRFTILRFEEGNHFYVRLEDGREGYVFPLDGYLAG